MLNAIIYIEWSNFDYLMGFCQNAYSPGKSCIKMKLCKTGNLPRKVKNSKGNYDETKCLDLDPIELYETFEEPEWVRTKSITLVAKGKNTCEEVY